VYEHPEVVAAAPFVLTQGLFSAGFDYTEGAYVRGIDPDTGSMAVTSLPQRFASGDLSFRTESDTVDGGIVLGYRLGERLSAYPGDVVTVISPAGSSFNRSLGALIPRWWTFEVTGHLRTGMFEYDNAYGVVRRDIAQQFAGLDQAVTGVEVRLRDPWDARRVGAELEEMLGYPYRAFDWQSQNASLFSALVRDKTREIGILRAMGLPSRVIRRTFIIQGAVIGVVGTTLGTGLGLTLGYLVDKRRIIDLNPAVYFIDHLPVRIDPIDLGMVILASIAVAVLATIYPARQASTLNPVDAIRYE
jgi:lipoprotein-releasing system permease protein